MLPKNLERYRVKKANPTAKRDIIKTTFRLDREAYEIVKEEFKVSELVEDMIIELATKIKKEREKEAKKKANTTAKVVKETAKPTANDKPKFNLKVASGTEEGF